MTRDLTVGKPYKVIIGFAVPILLGNLLQQFYSIVDTVIVGQFIGLEALAGVGSTGALNYFILGFVVGTCTGFAIPIAQSYGAKNYSDLKKYYTHSIYLGAVISLIFTVVTLMFLDDILYLMNTNDEMFPYAKSYIATIFAGIFGSCLYNLMASVLRAVGDSKTPLYFLIGSAISNIVLDLLFVIVFNWGVFGTAFATVISQTTAGVLCIILINKKFEILKTNKENWQFDAKIFKKLIIMGVPMGLQCSITALGIIILQAAINTLGTIYVAAITAGEKFNGFAMNMLETLGLSMATFAGQNLGAGKIERINKGLKQSLLMGFAYSIVLFVLFYFTSDYLSLILVSPEETEVIANIRIFLLIESGAYIINAMLHIFRNTVQGLGFSGVAMFAGVMELIARVVIAFGFVSSFGYVAAVLSEPIAWIAAVAFLVPAYYIIMRKLRKKHLNLLSQ
ncbi:MAG: MATE family efflux transporter [Clostridia bacterium]